MIYRTHVDSNQILINAEIYAPVNLGNTSTDHTQLFLYAEKTYHKEKQDQVQNRRQNKNVIVDIYCQLSEAVLICIRHVIHVSC